MSKIDDLIKILHDNTSSDAEKDDAAIELGNYTEVRAEEVFFKV